MKIALVFGGSGFIGSHMIEKLLNSGYRVVNCDMDNRLRKEVLYKDFFSYEALDITDAHRVLQVVNKYRPAIIFNFVAMQDIFCCNEAPINAINVNVIGNLNILEAIRRCNNIYMKTKYIYASSVYVHSDISGVYGITKSTSEALIRHYLKKHGLNYLILRYGTVYGSGATASNSIRKIIDVALKTRVISYYGSGTEVREYIHVSDAATYTMEAIEKNIINQALTISGLNPIKSKDLVLLLKDILGPEYSIDFRGEFPDDHYMVTPYRSEVELSSKYIGDTCLDLGAGLLSVIEELRSK